MDDFILIGVNDKVNLVYYYHPKAKKIYFESFDLSTGVKIDGDWLFSRYNSLELAKEAIDEHTPLTYNKLLAKLFK